MGLNDRPLGAGGGNDQGLLHGRNIGSAEFGFHFVQLLGLVGLIVGLHQQLESEGIVLILFQLGDRFLSFLLVHQKSAGCAMVRTLNHVIAGTTGERFELLQSLLGQWMIASAGGTHRAVAEDVRHLLIAIGGGNDGLMVERFLGQLEVFQGDDVVGLIFRQMTVGLRFLQALFLAVSCLAVSRNSLSASA